MFAFFLNILFKKDFSLIQYEVKNALINGGIVYNLSKHNRSFLGCFNNGRAACITRELFLVYSLWTWTWNAIYCWWVIRNTKLNICLRDLETAFITYFGSLKTSLCLCWWHISQYWDFDYGNDGCLAIKLLFRVSCNIEIIKRIMQPKSYVK